MSTRAPYKVLFLCTGNSARSIIAEHVLRAKGGARFESFSAGSHPVGKVNPYAIEVLGKHFSVDTSQARSKSWDEYRGMHFDFVITVCDKAREICPVWPARTVVAHWSSPDPVEIPGDHEKSLKSFLAVATQISARIGLFTIFRDDQLDTWPVQDIGNQFVHAATPRS